MNTDEIWKDIPQWEHCYQASNLGRIRSKDRKVHHKFNGTKLIRGRILKLQHDKYGYLTAHLRDKLNNKNKLCKVHRLVAETFLANCNCKENIDHINGKRDDNRVENLRWCTVKENANFENARINRSESIRKSYIKNPELRKIRSDNFRRIARRKIISVYKDGFLIGVFSSLSSAAEELNLKICSISACLNGRIKTIKGYKITSLNNG